MQGRVHSGTLRRSWSGQFICFGGYIQVHISTFQSSGGLDNESSCWLTIFRIRLSFVLFWFWWESWAKVLCALRLNLLPRSDLVGLGRSWSLGGVYIYILLSDRGWVHGSLRVELWHSEFSDIFCWSRKLGGILAKFFCYLRICVSCFSFFNIKVC